MYTQQLRTFHILGRYVANFVSVYYYRPKTKNIKLDFHDPYLNL